VQVKIIIAAENAGNVVGIKGMKEETKGEEE